MSCFAPNSVLKCGVLRFHVFDLTLIVLLSSDDIPIDKCFGFFSFYCSFHCTFSCHKLV
jgi:hypothetical protein